MRPTTPVRLLLLVSALLAWRPVSSAATAQEAGHGAAAPEAVGLAAFRAAVQEPVRPWLVELDGEPGFRLRLSAGERAGGLTLREALARNAHEAFAEQDSVLERAGAAGVRALLRVRDVVQPDGSRRRVEYRFTTS